MHPAGRHALHLPRLRASGRWRRVCTGCSADRPEHVPCAPPRSGWESIQDGVSHQTCPSHRQVVVFEVQAHAIARIPALLAVAQQHRQIDDRDLGGYLRQVEQDVAVTPVPPAALDVRHIDSLSLCAEPQGIDTAWKLGRLEGEHDLFALVDLIRCSLGRGTSAASRCMNSSGLMTRCAVRSRHGVLSLSPTCPAALSCTRSSDDAEPGYKQSSGLFAPGDGAGHSPGAVCKAAG